MTPPRASTATPSIWALLPSLLIVLVLTGLAVFWVALCVASWTVEP